MDTSSLIGKTLNAIHTFACEPVHPAWQSELTTPIATSMAVLRFADGVLVRVAPCEVELDPARYPSLGLGVDVCDSSAFQLETTSEVAVTMQPLAGVAAVVPLAVLSVREADPLGEGAVSQLELVASDGTRIVFRHIMPPMTLGIELVRVGQAPNNSIQRTPTRYAGRRR